MRGFVGLGLSLILGNASVFTSHGSGAEPFVACYARFASQESSIDINAGRLLLTELSCTACHAADVALAPKGGPVLQGLGTRFQSAWLRSYLNDPTAGKPGGSMPHLLHAIPDAERSRAIEALLAFLSIGRSIEPKLAATGSNPIAHEFWRKGDIERGRGLYHQIGCIACHAIDQASQPAAVIQSDLERKIESLGLEPDELKELGLVIPKPIQPVPMGNPSAKYTSRSLTMFLLAPHLTRASGRMPSLKLLPHEAADIAAYLIGDKTAVGPISMQSRVDDPASVAIRNSGHAALADEGKRLFGKFACANCHPHPDVQPRLAKPLAQLDMSKGRLGCLAKDPTADPETPQFGLSDQQASDLRRAIVSFQRAEARSATNDLELSLLQLNCYACHERDGRGGIGPKQGPYFENVQQVDIGDEGRLPPPLDYVGKKLKPAWLDKVLEGTGDVRPHFRIRMPVFSAHAKSVAAALQAVDRPQSLPEDSTRFKAAKLETSDVNAGRELLDMGCVQCHMLRGESLPGAIGIDLADLQTRILPDWFHAFLVDPASLKKNTRMPSFFPDGKSASPHILNGDVDRQIASLWGYLNAKDQPLPAKLEQNQTQLFELKPVDRPIVLRTFMEKESAGTNAIAVGFSQQTHFAFDANSVRLAEIWKGRFLNAHGTWFDRFAPPVMPLGTERIRLPLKAWFEQGNSDSDRNVAIRSSDDRSTRPTFRGYRLAENGVPTFLYSIGSLAIEDCLEPDSERGLVRRISVKPTEASTEVASTACWLAIVDDAIALDAAGICSTQSNLMVSVSGATDQRLIKHGSVSQWLIGIPGMDGEVKVSYRW